MSIAPSQFSAIPTPSATELNGGAPFVPIAGRLPNVLPHRWTVAEAKAAVRTGVLPENNKCELIRGELIRKMVVGNSHMAALKRLNQWFSRVPGDRFLVGIQDMIELVDSLPEPDFTLLVPVPDCYESRTAGPADILLLVEVSDSSIKYDQTIKLPLYAENGVREFWIVNLEEERIEVYRQPQASGRYGDVQHFRRGQTVIPLELPDLSLPVEAVLGPAAKT